MASTAALVALLSTLTFLSGGERHLAPPPVLVAADPVRLRIPAIDVAAPVDPLVVDGNGVLPAPTSFCADRLMA